MEESADAAAEKFLLEGNRWDDDDATAAPSTPRGGAASRNRGPPASAARAHHPSVDPGSGKHTRFADRSAGANDHSPEEVEEEARRAAVGQSFESLDYDMFESRVTTAYDVSAKGEAHTHGAAKWLVTAVIGVCTAMVAIFIDFGVKRLERIRLDLLTDTYADEQAGTALFRGQALLSYIACSCAYVAIASFLVAYVEPVAGGSGIPEIKTLLNGINVPRAVRFKTLVAKSCGVLFSVAGGLPCGKEGPMIHAGAILAAAISQGKSAVFGFDLSFSKFASFRNDREKRDFIACGAAAGVAAAFGAPVGGMLFALEEGASFWHPGLTWRSFFCAVCSAWTLSLLLCSKGMAAADDKVDGGAYTCEFGYVGTSEGTFGFGVFDLSLGKYLAWYLAVFALMGAVGGLMGALFNHMNHGLTLWRKRHRDQGGPPRTTPAVKRRRLGEAVLVAAVVACVAFGASTAFGRCQQHPAVPVELRGNSIITESAIDFERLVRLDCPPGQYNDLASLFLVPASEAIKNLFHLKSFTRDLVRKSSDLFASECLGASNSSFCVGDEEDGGGSGRLGSVDCLWNQTAAGPGGECPVGGGCCTPDLRKYGLLPSQYPRYGYSASSVLVFLVCYYLLSCWTYGLAVPSGLFVPSLLAGAAYGHLWYQLLDEAGVNALQPEIHPGLFTLVGAASLLGGMARMTISLAVILLELTGVINWGPPVMIALLSARWVGNAFNEGLYDIHVHLNGYDFLEYKPSAEAKSHQLLVHHVMTAAPVCVAEVVRAGDLLDMLQRNSHNGFPVIPCEDPYEHNDAAAVRRRHSSTAADDDDEGGPAPALPSVNRASSMRSPSGIHLADVARNFSGIVMRKHLCVALARLDLQPMRGIHKAAAPAAEPSGASNPAAGAGEQPRRGADGSEQMDDGEGRDQFDGEGQDRFVPLEGEGDDPPMPFPYTRMPRPEGEGDAAAALSRGRRGTAFRNVMGEGGGGGGDDERSAAASMARWSKRHAAAPSHAPDDEALHFPDLERSFPRYPKAGDISLTPAQRSLWLDITPYINATPPVVFTDAPVKRAFSLFRGLGMRHLVAVDRNNNVSGIITRHDLTNHRLSHVAAKQSAHSADKVRHTYTPSKQAAGAAHKQRGRRKRKSSYAPEPVGLPMRK